jgi:MoaA/NifB/PqqE/SkfB family radical SAM enzyme
MCSGKFSSSIRKNREKMPAYNSPYNNENFINEITPFILNAKQINFFGGEPFLISTYDKIFDILLKNKSAAELYIQTNGTVFSNKIEQILNKLNVNLSVSVDGGTEEVYEEIRKNASFVTVSENCKKFNNILTKRKKSFYISSVICTKNARDLTNLIIFANKHNAKIYFHHVHNPNELSIEALGAKELKDITSFYETNISIINKFLPKNENYNSLMDAIDFFKKTHKRRVETQNTDILDKLRILSPEKYNFLLELSKLHNLDINIFNNEFEEAVKRKDNMYFTESWLDNIIKSDLSDFKHMVNGYINFNEKI